MQENEVYLGGVTSPWLGRRMRVCAIHATSRRMIGTKVDTRSRVEKFVEIHEVHNTLGNYVGWPTKSVNVLSSPTREELDMVFNTLMKSKDFEIKKEEIKQIQLKTPGILRGGHIKFLLKTGKEIEVHMHSCPQHEELSEKVRKLMQAFYPEVLKVED